MSDSICLGQPDRWAFAVAQLSKSGAMNGDGLNGYGRTLGYLWINGERTWLGRAITMTMGLSIRTATAEMAGLWRACSEYDETIGP